GSKVTWYSPQARAEYEHGAPAPPAPPAPAPEAPASTPPVTPPEPPRRPERLIHWRAAFLPGVVSFGADIRFVARADAMRETHTSLRQQRLTELVEVVTEAVRGSEAYQGLVALEKKIGEISSQAHEEHEQAVRLDQEANDAIRRGDDPRPLREEADGHQRE